MKISGWFLDKNIRIRLFTSLVLLINILFRRIIRAPLLTARMDFSRVPRCSHFSECTHQKCSIPQNCRVVPVFTETLLLSSILPTFPNFGNFPTRQHLATSPPGPKDHFLVIVPRTNPRSAVNLSQSCQSVSLHYLFWHEASASCFCSPAAGSQSSGPTVRRISSSLCPRFWKRTNSTSASSSWTNTSCCCAWRRWIFVASNDDRLRPLGSSEVVIGGFHCDSRSRTTQRIR